MFRFREIKTNEKITDKTVTTSFNPDERIKPSTEVEMVEVEVFDPDVRGCYRTVMVPAASGTTEG